MSNEKYMEVFKSILKQDGVRISLDRETWAVLRNDDVWVVYRHYSGKTAVIYENNDLTDFLYYMAGLVGLEV